MKSKDFDLNELAYDKARTSCMFQLRKIASFREVTKVLGSIFHLSREQTFQLLKTWERKHWVKIHAYHGVEFVKKN